MNMLRGYVPEHVRVSVPLYTWIGLPATRLVEWVSTCLPPTGPHFKRAVNPRVLRERRFISSAMWVRSAALQGDRSVPFGRN
jgi:hypothetical protein